MADHIQNIECKIVFLYQRYQNTEWQTTHYFLFSYLRSMRSMVKSLQVIELDAVTHWRVMGVLWDVSSILLLSRLYKQKFLPQLEYLLSLFFCWFCPSHRQSLWKNFEYLFQKALMSASEQFSGVGKLSVFNCTHKKRQKDWDWNTNKALKPCGKNKLLLYQLNKGASVIYLEKHGAQVCKEQSGRVWPGPAEPWNSLRRRTKPTGPGLGVSVGSGQWGGLGQTEIGCHRPNTAHGWLRKFPKWKMLTKWEILWRKYQAPGRDKALVALP